MDGLRNQIFAGAAFALNQDSGRLAGGHFLHEAHELRCLGRHGHDLVISSMAADLSAQRLDFGAQARSLQRVLDGDPQFLEIQWLTYKIVSSKFNGSLHIIQLRVRGNHDDGRSFGSFLDLFEHLDAAEVRHADVKQDEIRRLMLGEAEAGVSGGGFQDLIAPLLTLLAQGPAHQALVIHNKDLLCPRHAALAYYG